jgi:hypothetical protein
MPDLFTILSLLQLTKDGPAAFPHPPGNLLIAEPLPLQFNHFIEERSLLAPSLDDFFGLWVSKMPSESFRPEFHQIDEFNFDSAFVNSDNSASHSLGQTNLRKIRPSFRDGPFGLFRRIILIAPSLGGRLGRLYPVFCDG